MKSHQLRLGSLEGKTIKRVFSDYTDTMLIVFDDQTLCCLVGYECDQEVILENDDFRITDWRKYAEELLSLGVVTQEEFDGYKADQARQAEACKENRKKQYEAMKAEFESA